MRRFRWRNGMRRLRVRWLRPRLRVFELQRYILRLGVCHQRTLLRLLIDHLGREDKRCDKRMLRRRTHPSMTSEYVSGSFLIASTTTPLKSPALSIPPRNTTPTAENKHELSSGTTLNSRNPFSPGNSTESVFESSLGGLGVGA